MSWKKINEFVEMFEEPVLGSERPDSNERFMALCIDPSSKNLYRGIVRIITKREGDVNIVGFVDKSKLMLVESKDLLKWNIVKDLKIKDIDKIIKKFEEDNMEFIGLEDPDIFVEDNRLKHIYFTIAYKYKNRKGYKIYLGHAIGESLDKLTANDPVISGSKEVTISPIAEKDYRYVLAESWFRKPEEGISLLKAEDMGKNWKFERLVFKPDKNSPSWCKGYASPCRFFNSSFVDIRDNLLLGICTGNSGEYIKEGIEMRGNFEPGLFIFNNKTGDIPWIAEKPLFKDPTASTITFASELITLNEHEAILFAHSNDSFIRAYRLNIDKLKKLLPKDIQKLFKTSKKFPHTNFR